MVVYEFSGPTPTRRRRGLDGQTPAAASVRLVQDPSRGGRRVTIGTSRASAGVSKGAVSYALNGLPGVSARRAARSSGSRRARLVPEPRRAGAVGGASYALRLRPRASGADARARAVLHGVRRGRRVGAVGALGRTHAPARPDVAARSRSIGAGGPSAGSTASSSSTCGSTIRGSRRSSSSACPLSSSAARRGRAAGRLARRAAPVVEAVRYLARARPRRIARVAGLARVRAHRSGGRARSARSPPSSASTPRSSTPTTRPRAARGRRDDCSRAPTPPTGDRRRQRRARRHRPRRRAPRWASPFPTTSRSSPGTTR